MKKLLMLLLLALAMGTQAIHAGEKGDKTPSFWERLRAKIESLTPQKKSTVTTATGGIRGAPVASEDIYWKDEASAESIAADELEAFTQAMKLTDAEDKAQAQSAFAEFIKKYPDSALRKDADQALTLLQNPSAPAK
jgi:TolA-binding protein